MPPPHLYLPCFATLENLKIAWQLKWFRLGWFSFFLLLEPDLLIRFTECGRGNSCAGAMEGVVDRQTDRWRGTDKKGWRSSSRGPGCMAGEESSHKQPQHILIFCLCSFSSLDLFMKTPYLIIPSGLHIQACLFLGLMKADIR